MIVGTLRFLPSRERHDFTATLLLVVWLAIPLTASSQHGPADQAPERIEKSETPEIKNFSRIESSAGFGGATRPAAMIWLKTEGFASVINLRLASEDGVQLEESRAAARAAGLRYIHLPFDSKDPSPSIVDTFLAAIRDEQNQPAYVHCGSATRAAALWMIARVVNDGWEIDRARAEARSIALKPDEADAFATKYLESRGE